MEEAALLKERLLAITDKRKLQEGITQKRLKVEEEKLKLQHLKKKALREKWLLDGVSVITPKEQEEMQRQNQEDQQLAKLLERNILRLDEEIEQLEQQELQISANEVRILKKLKSVERTSEDIIRAVQAVKAEVREEPVEYIYSNIPDLPKSYRPSMLQRDVHGENDNDEQRRKALFAMEIKVEKDKKTGESTVLSTIPLPSEEFKNTGVKVYDDGRKSVYAVDSPAQNGVDTLDPVEVEDLLRKATEKSAVSPTEYHEPVFSYPYSSSPTPPQKEHTSEPPNQDRNMKENGQLNGHPNNSLLCETNCHESQENGFDVPKLATFVSQVKETKPEEPWIPRNQETKIEKQHKESTQDQRQSYTDMRDNYREAMFRNSECSNGVPSPGFEDDIKYNLVHAMPCYIDDNEPVTMVFMGYQHVDDDTEQNRKLSDFDGIIRAELVVIDDDEDDKEIELSKAKPSSPIARQINQSTNENNVRQKSPISSLNINLNKSHYINSISLEEQQATLGKPKCHEPADGQILEDGTEDPSLTALRIRMAKLGKRVI